MKVTIQDLADHLGISKGTVSRALRGYADVSASTVARVQQAAKKLGYQPSAVAQGIKTGLARSVGLILLPKSRAASRPFLMQFINGISTSIAKQGYTLTVATAQSDAEMVELHRDLFVQRKVDGFILPRTMHDDPRIQILDQLKAPLVLYGQTENLTQYSWFDINQVECFRRATARLLAFGHRHLAFLGGDAPLFYNSLRRKGVELGIQEFEREEVQLQIFENITTVPDGLECAIRLLKSPQPPTGFLCALDLSALGVIRAIKQLELIPGEHISVIGYEGIPEGDFSEPGLTTFEVDQYEAGFQCGVKLMQLIHEKGAKVSGTLTMAVLLERGSDGPVRFTSTELATFIRNRKRLLSSQEKLHRMTEKSLRN